MYLKPCIQKLDKNDLLISEKSKILFKHVNDLDLGPPVPEKKVFEGLPHIGMAAILVMWPASC